jgi:cycloartenol synthase
MWKFKSASDAGGPHLVSLNDNKGRQTWEFDPNAGTPDQRARVEELRAAFTANRHKQKHSADELLRLQVADKIAAKKYSPPSTELKPGEIPSAERVEQHLLGAISFYECLQQDDGHFPGMM